MGYTLNKINITDDFMFATVLKNNKGVCKRLLESILGFEISSLEYVKDQGSINSYRDSHGIRLDVIAKDSSAVYDIEMQKANDDDIIKRSRYYQGQIDTAELIKGISYKKLKNTYIIFICTFDLFGLDRYIYRFENYDKDLGLSYGDGAKKIIVNTKGHKGDISDDLKSFIDYINSPEYANKELVNDLIRQLDETVTEYSIDKEWRTVYMKYEADRMYLLSKGRSEGRAEGMAEGISVGRREGRMDERSLIRKVFELARAGESTESIASAIGMPVEYVEETLEMAFMK